MFNGYSFNASKFNSVVSAFTIDQIKMYADIYINNEPMNVTVDNNQMSAFVMNDAVELTV